MSSPDLPSEQPSEPSPETASPENTQTQREGADQLPANPAPGASAAKPLGMPASEEEASLLSMAHVKSYLMYSLSLPERALRSGVSLAGGMVQESTELLVPQAFQSSSVYKAFVSQSLEFLLHDIGGVKKGADAEQGAVPENFVARKAVGNFVELAGLASLHLSPMLVLASLSDIAYGSKAYVLELAEELEKQGVIDDTSTIHHVDDLADAIARATGTAAGAFNTPPLSVDGIYATINETQSSVREINPTKLLPKAEVQRMWEEMREIAEKENVSLLDVSSAMTLHSMNKIGIAGKGALCTVKAAGNLVDRHVFAHYQNAIADLRNNGFYATVAESSKPYIEAVYENFSTDKETLTEDMLSGRLVGRMWKSMNNWWKGTPPVADKEAPVAPEKQAEIEEKMADPHEEVLSDDPPADASEK
ncbi:Hypothetical protein PBC10988_15460 [Planctomycetales bacterium 10988]|nr:Hypothetical protein PBC10988_15460 [Planctomycetales bacterium 10988]